MSNEILLQKKRAAIGKDLSRRNFQIVMRHLGYALNWKKGHLAGSAMHIYFRLRSLVHQLLAWRMAFEAPVVNGSETPNVQYTP